MLRRGLSLLALVAVIALTYAWFFGLVGDDRPLASRLIRGVFFAAVFLGAQAFLAKRRGVTLSQSLTGQHHKSRRDGR